MLSRWVAILDGDLDALEVLNDAEFGALVYRVCRSTDWPLALATDDPGVLARVGANAAARVRGWDTAWECAGLAARAAASDAGLVAVCAGWRSHTARFAGQVETKSLQHPSADIAILRSCRAGTVAACIRHFRGDGMGGVVSPDSPTELATLMERHWPAGVLAASSAVAGGWTTDWGTLCDLVAPSVTQPGAVALWQQLGLVLGTKNPRAGRSRKRQIHALAAALSAADPELVAAAAVLASDGTLASPLELLDVVAVLV